MPLVRHSSAVAVVALALVAAPTARAGGRASEHEVKAALLFNFLKFVEWPPTAAEEPIDLCVVGHGPLLAAMSTLDGRAVGERRVSVRYTAPGGAPRCTVALIAGSERANVEALAERLARAGALVVGDGEALASRGAHLAFYLHDDRVRFEANLATIRRDRLKVSSKLLRLARLVEGTP